MFTSSFAAQLPFGAGRRLNPASPVVRALVSWERTDGDERLAESAIGCAKLALVSVERSRAALMSLRATLDAADIDRLVTALDVLARGLEQRFPLAPSYVRYGLDCPVA